MACPDQDRATEHTQRERVGAEIHDWDFWKVGPERNTISNPAKTSYAVTLKTDLVEAENTDRGRVACAALGVLAFFSLGAFTACPQ